MKKFLAAILIVILAAVGVAGVFAYQLYRAADVPYQGYPSDTPPLIEVTPGMGTQAIGQRLIDAGVIRDRWTYRIAIWRSGNARRLQAGEYRFDRPLSAMDVIDKIVRGDIDVVALTFPEGLTIAEMAGLFENAGFGTAVSFVDAAKDASLVREIDPEARDLEGYLFPDTYSLSRRTDAPRLVRTMADRFMRQLPADVREAASARGLSIRQLVTLASIVEKETARPEERALVASVYSNRLRINMPLQCDPTVIYALVRAGRFNGNLRRDDLAIESPYNTYRYPGLPPGPVAAPGLQSLRAAAQPAATEYLYFVSRNDGSHEFARTLAEHNRNVQKFQIEYFRQKRLAEGRASR